MATRRTAMFKEKQCQACGNTFVPTAPAAKYCCGAPSKSKEALRKYAAAYRARRGSEVGVGKGRSSKNRGPTHSQYKNGWTAYKQIGRQMKEEIGCCERCDRDLTKATRWEWVCHHKDHDRTNSSRDNLELLCKSCHQIEHKCWKAFEGATTIRKE